MAAFSSWHAPFSKPRAAPRAHVVALRRRRDGARNMPLSCNGPPCGLRAPNSRPLIFAYTVFGRGRQKKGVSESLIGAVGNSAGPHTSPLAPPPLYFEQAHGRAPRNLPIHCLR